MHFKNRIAVIMSVYNTSFNLVKRAIDSVLNQDYQDFELIIIDDGSNNGTQSQILNYAIEHEEKITYLRHKNRSQAESINRGMLISNSEFITVIDADDEYKPNHLSTCLSEIKSLDLIASTTETIVNQESDYYVPDRFDHNQVIHVDNCILFATLFGKKEVFTMLNFQDMYGSDAHFYERAEEKFAVKKLDLRTYIYYRNNLESLTAKIKSKAQLEN
ncbi:glycosyltransferase family 2 protein [Pedobacter changchengzhani]|uniref:Glycosyltransferase family 2 protein n=1 Tax=Pedobacter changchengzhani TaxID=2529274 RepID=A0A4R5MHH1_9SPHI|nr:glycosyltransferase family A protein [Pedobacter changchengzhani]TDG34962.1 glycosyltransferase family 2 protein [Pedobacter changchengzhani]